MKAVICSGLCRLTALFVYFINLDTFSQSERIDFFPHKCILIRGFLSQFEDMCDSQTCIVIFRTKTNFKLTENHELQVS
jgi:hypothetical protein